MANPSTPPTPKKTQPALYIIGAIILAIVIARTLSTDRPRPGSEKEAASAEEVENEKARNRAKVSRIAGETKQAPKATPARLREDRTTVSAQATPAEEPPPFESKKQYLMDDFRGGKKDLTGYKLDGITQTSEGLTLAPADPKAEEGAVRKGVMESPTVQLEFPSNYMMPLWKAKMNESAGLTVEVAISPDGSDWSRWFPLGPNPDEISPTYPDGSPNPNYGFQGGEGIANGTRVYPFARYRVTLTSGDPAAAPILEAFRMYYVDSAGPDAVLAEKAFTGTGVPEKK